MVPVAVILDDAELVRVLAHLGLVTEFPRTKPARSPPLPLGGEDSQVEPAAHAWDGGDDVQGRVSQFRWRREREFSPDGLDGRWFEGLSFRCGEEVGAKTA